VRTVFHTVLLFSVYLLFAGHNAPGGGFAGGLVAGAALVLKAVEGGSAAVPGAAAFGGLLARPGTLLGAGITLAGLTGAAPLLAGGEFLESSKLTLHLPLLGKVTASSTLPFDIGVYLVVVGLVVTLLRTLGEERTSDTHEGDTDEGDTGGGDIGPAAEPGSGSDVRPGAAPLLGRVERGEAGR
jgi:multicomponent Na+:H+ antiporter subunit A